MTADTSNVTEEAGPSRPPRTARNGPLSYAIFSLARAHRGYAAQLLRRLGLHPGQELLLMQLLDRDGQLQSQLLSSVGLDQSTVSKSLRRMQEAGLLVREPAPHDGRALSVTLTDRGRALEGPLTELWAELDVAAGGDLSSDAVTAFIGTATVIQQAITESSTASASTPPPSAARRRARTATPPQNDTPRTHRPSSSHHRDP